MSNFTNHFESATEKGIETIEDDLKTASKKSESKREEIKHAMQRINTYIEETEKNAITKLVDWKTDMDIKKIEKMADKQEQQAVDAIMVAAYACLEAEVAILDALKSRKMAIEVAG